MAGGAVVSVGGNAHIAHLVDPNRTWYNNRRYVDRFVDMSSLAR